jgi:hypothetical protein
MIEFNRHINEQGYLTSSGRELANKFIGELNNLLSLFEGISEQQALLLNSVLAKEVGDACSKFRAQLKT